MKKTIEDTRERDVLALHFLADHVLVHAGVGHKQTEAWAREVLGTGNLRRVPAYGTQGVDTESSKVFRNEGHLYQVCHRYARIREFCRVLGVSHVYDIGCQFVNQSYLWIENTTMGYTGITNGHFSLNDFLPEDREKLYYDILETDDVPAPLCGGRIDYLRGEYPDISLSPEPGSIAVACFSFTMTGEEDRIAEIAAGLRRDFDRALFNIRYRSEEVVALWRRQDWEGYTVVPAGPEGFLFATKHPEDLDRLRETYPLTDSGFATGIDDGIRHFMHFDFGEDGWQGRGWEKKTTD